MKKRTIRKARIVRLWIYGFHTTNQQIIHVPSVTPFSVNDNVGRASKLAIAIYENRTEIKENYNTRGAAVHFVFEGRLYKHLDTSKKYRRIIITYRCEKEKHDVKIYVRAGIVIDVRAFYKI